MGKYSNLKNVQIIISLLKEYNIKNLVLSPGGRSVSFEHSVEQDDFFTCYSIVDERSAAFFALGLIQQLNEPVAVICSSGTASCNYVSAVAEAFYQQLPLVVITTDRNPMYLNQQEEQMIPQINLFKDFCNKEVNLPHVRDEKDFWFASRLVNEALLELNHFQNGPVHINYPIENNYPEHQGIVRFEVEKLPKIKKIERLTLQDSNEKLENWKKDFSNKKILIIYGQNNPVSTKELNFIESFSKNYNCVISTDSLSNLSCYKTIDTYLLDKIITKSEFENLLPDIVITMGGNSISALKNRFVDYTDKIRHIHVSANGNVSDPFKCLPDIIEMTSSKFFETFSCCNNNPNDEYFRLWKNCFDKYMNISNPYDIDVSFSAVYAIQKSIGNIPEGSLIHFGNSNSVRICSLFELKKNISVYCNRGTNGIDGSMSSFIGNAYASNNLSFLYIGDLRFFYDVNALWNKYLTPKIRIMVINNGGGAIFHNYPGLKNVPTIDNYIAAEHNASVKAWCEDRGFKYIKGSTKEEFDNNIESFFIPDSDKPVVFECFTDKEIDTAEIKNFISSYKEANDSGLNLNKIKNKIKKNMSASTKEKIKKILGV